MMNTGSFQQRVRAWIHHCFAPTAAVDTLERGDRLLEEVLELLQAADYPQDRVDALKAYVYGRPAGRLFQEAGGVMLTLAGFCEAHDIQMTEAAETELERVWRNIETIRAKQASKPVGSELPGFAAQAGEL